MCVDGIDKLINILINIVVNVCHWTWAEKICLPVICSFSQSKNIYWELNTELGTFPDKWEAEMRYSSPVTVSFNTHSSLRHSRKRGKEGWLGRPKESCAGVAKEEKWITCNLEGKKEFRRSRLSTFTVTRPDIVIVNWLKNAVWGCTCLLGLL